MTDTVNGKHTLSVRGAAKSFPGVQALKGVDLDFHSGMIHAIVGANGAGKSTLMKILAGVYDSYEGDITLDGEVLRLTSPMTSKSHCIHTVYQEVDLSLVNSLTVAENIMLDKIVMDRSRIVIDWRQLKREAAQALAFASGVEVIDVARLVDELPLHQKQMVLIARALLQTVKFLLLDEPTAPLSAPETELLFRIIRELAARGVGIIYVSHRLGEVFDISDTITVLRDGNHIQTLETAQTNDQEVIRMMLGRQLDMSNNRTDRQPINRIVLSVRDLTAGDRVRAVSLDVRAGEILGIAGLVGAGKSELGRVIFGCDPSNKGTIVIKGKSIRRGSPALSVRHCVAFVPEERRKDALFLTEAVNVNVSIANLRRMSWFGFVQRGRERAMVSQIIKQLDIRTYSPEAKVDTLSGGNQQKVIVGRWLLTDADVYIFDEPTKGIDVGAKQDIFGLIKGLAERGKTVLYLSCEIEEVMLIAHRIMVMYNGTIVGQFDAATADYHHIMALAMGMRALDRGLNAASREKQL